MKKPFQIGDRVRIYYSEMKLNRPMPLSEIGKVLAVEGDLLHIDNGTDLFWSHVKQCRRLIPKKGQVAGYTRIKVYLK